MGADAGARRTSAFQVRVFRTPAGYLGWVDGLGTVEGRTLVEVRRAARSFVRDVVGSAFPDRPEIEVAGAEEVLRFTLELRQRRPGADRERSPS